ncbi:MAG: hypothetical protein LBF56_01870 [Holosporales bacterium]|jgi:hypothetical protein|nr:hypothetical protein [Holosporales bacterium]
MKLPERGGLHHDELESFIIDATESTEEKEYYNILSRVRVKVENVLTKIGVFRIMSDRYRNKR